jgi:hypothetical protein
MKKISRKYFILLLVVACIVAIWAIMPYCLALLNGKSSVAQTHRSDRIDEGIISANTYSFRRSIDFIYPVDDIRDPFVQNPAPTGTPKVQSPIGKTKIALTGIIWDDENPLAIISDSRNKSYIVETGGEVDGTKVVAIHTRSIVIEVNGRQQELILWPE